MLFKNNAYYLYIIYIDGNKKQVRAISLQMF